MLYAGVVAAELWNSSPYRGEGAKYVSPLDFVPELVARKKHDRTPQTLDQQIEVLTAVMRCGPGKVN
jgi:hypothetical protein